MRPAPSAHARPRRDEPSLGGTLLFVCLGGSVLVGILGGDAGRWFLVSLLVIGICWLLGIVGRTIGGAARTVDRGLSGPRRRRPAHQAPQGRAVQFSGRDGPPSSQPWWLQGDTGEVTIAELAERARGTRDPLLREPIEAGMAVIICMADRGRCGAVLPAEIQDDLTREFEGRCPVCNARESFRTTTVPHEPPPIAEPVMPPPLPGAPERASWSEAAPPPLSPAGDEAVPPPGSPPAPTEHEAPIEEATPIAGGTHRLEPVSVGSEPQVLPVAPAPVVAPLPEPAAPMTEPDEPTPPPRRMVFKELDP